MKRLPIILRIIVLALLVAAVALPSLWAPASVAGRVVRIRSAKDLASVADGLAGEAPAAISYESADAPTSTALAVLAAAGDQAPLFAAAPREVRVVDAAATPRMLAGRAAAVSFRIHGGAGDSARVYLAEAGAPVDSLVVRADARGDAEGAFRVRPAADGWREWQVRAAWSGGDSAVATTGAWVDSAGAPRVLVRAGFPDWESKFVVRALEESGAVVQTSNALGRGLAVQAGGGSISTDALARVDAVIVLNGAPLEPGEAAALAQWASRGGGVLLQGDRIGAPGFGLVRPAQADGTVDGSSIRWAAPPEIAPLPADRITTAARAFASAGTATSIAADAPGGGLLALRPLGQGRAAALGIGETWRWRMEAGRIDEHRDFWRSIADWLASARPEPLAIRLADASGPAGTRRDIRVYDARGDANAPVPPLVITRPSGATDTVRLARDPSSPGVLRGSFVPATAGVHTLAIAGQRPSAAFRADSATVVSRTAADADAWARLSLVAARSGGRLVPRDSLGATLAAVAAQGPAAPRGPSATLIFALLVIAATAEWAIRRLTGRE